MPGIFTKPALLAVALGALVTACGESEEPQGPLDGVDAGGAYDAAVVDAATFDASAWPDASVGDDAGAGGDASADGGDAGNADAGPPALKPKCVKKDSQVLIIGDSFINWISHKFPEQIKTVTMQDWRMLAVGGTAMGSGGIGRIPDQFDQAIKADPDAHTVVMDGGGNDILVPDAFLDAFGTCRETGSSKLENCQKIVKTALDAADALMSRAVTAGIRDVVYFFYPYIPENRLIGGPHPNEILDYALPMVRDFCNGVESKTKGKTRCHFLDMIPVFKGHRPGFDGVTAGSEADWFNEDIHPNAKGSQGMVDAVWKLMQDRCLGQKGKDCCEP